MYVCFTNTITQIRSSFWWWKLYNWLDGFRTIWTKFDTKVKIYTLDKNEITSKFPKLTTLPIPNGTVLEVEIIVTDKLGRPDFEAVMERLMSSKSEHQISFTVFDIIYYLRIPSFIEWISWSGWI